MVDHQLDKFTIVSLFSIHLSYVMTNVYVWQSFCKFFTFDMSIDTLEIEMTRTAK